MPLMTRPSVEKFQDGSKYFEHEYKNFSVKTIIINQ